MAEPDAAAAERRRSAKPRPRLLFIAPLMPAAGGNGLAMRAGLFLDGLAADWEVTLLVVPVADREGGLPDGFVRDRCASVVVRPLDGYLDPLYGLIARLKDPTERGAALASHPVPLMGRYGTPSAVRDAAAAVPAGRFDLVHVMRLYMLPFAAPFLRASPVRPSLTLDLDDIESLTRARLAALEAAAGRSDAARLHAAEAEKYARLEREALPACDGVFVCSEADAVRLRALYPGVRAEAIPNAVELPGAVSRQAAGRRFDCLFVGSMGYAPNADAALFFCREILPRLRERLARPVTAAIVGSHPGPDVRALAGTEGVTVTGPVPEVASFYRSSRLAVVPVRAGGGTRIKLLEAFAFGLPVVSTPLGAEGLQAVDGEHLLLADGAVPFAEACSRLLRDRGLADGLRGRARALLRRRYAWPLVRRRIGDRFASIGNAPKVAKDW